MPTDKSQHTLPRIGITQGRLSLPAPGVIQAFPVWTWQEEFKLAAQAGFECIEWVYQADTEACNPLASQGGADQIRSMIHQYGVQVHSVSGDIYMQQRLISHDGKINRENVAHLESLLRRSRMIGANHVMIPLVDGGRLETALERASLITILRLISSNLASLGMQIHLETDWLTDTWADVMRKIEDKNVRICYDIGDRAAKGYDLQKDLTMLGKWIGSIHIKDRELGGTTVPLGTGHANLKQALRAIIALEYRGPYILQAAPQPNISPYDLAIKNKTLINELILSI